MTVTEDQPDELLAMRDLAVSYRTAEGPLPAVRGVDLVVHAGEVVGVAGESGCGKSTLVSTVLRLQPKDAAVDRARSRSSASDVQTMLVGRPAGAALGRRLDRLPGRAALAEPGAAGRASRSPSRSWSTSPTWPRTASQGRVVELLEQVGLSAERGRAYPHQLSGGQKQRVMIAMALACRPQLIVADEPTTALDVMVQAQILDLLSTLVRDLGVGLLIISHDLSVLADVCDRVVVMYAGRVVEGGTAAADLHRPAAPLLHGAFRRVPAGRRPGGPLRAGRAGRRPAGPAGAAPGLLLRAPLPAGGRPVLARPSRRWSRSPPAGRWPASGWVSRERGSPDGSGTPSSATTPLLEAQGVQVEFVTRTGHAARALDGVDLSVRRGEVLAIVGESGSGKTTLARTLMGLQRPTTGEVLARWPAARLLDPRAAKPAAAGCRWCCRTPPARSTRGRPSTSRSPRGSGCTSRSAPTSRAATRPSWSPPPWPRPGCGRPSGCSCATPTSCPAARSSGS